jgi:hypothetical protein
MSKNILLTSLSTKGIYKPLRYYSANNEFDHSYCEAMQSMEASTKYILSRFPIDEILVIGDEMSLDNENSLKPFRLMDAGELYSAEPQTLSPFGLYRSRLAQALGEQSLEQQVCNALLPEEEREKLAAFILDFQEQNSQREPKRLNRLFDELAHNRQMFGQFLDALAAAFPAARENPSLYMNWVNNYLYMQLKPTAKMEILPVNENICARYIPAAMLDSREYWVNTILGMTEDVFDTGAETNLFVSLDNNSSVDSHLVMNLLDILVSTPGSSVHIKKIYKVYESSSGLTGEICDHTAVFRTTDLVAAAHAFLNYSKTDMLVDFWESSSERNDRVSSLIYAARHVDVGISMCNIKEVQAGIQRLRNLLRDTHSWTKDGYYGLLFGVIAGSIKADYRSLLEGDGPVPFIELIKWAYRHQLYQQVLTLIETYAPANLVNSGIFYYCSDESQVNDIAKVLALQRLEMKSYEYYKMDDIDHYFIKYYDRGGVKLNGSRGEDRNLVYAATRVQSIGRKDPDRISGHTACDSLETVQNVLYAYFHLGFVRNKISHADADALSEVRLIVSESDISSAMLLMRESIEYFIISYEKALEEVKGKNPKIVAVSPDAVRNVADRLRRERIQEERAQDSAKK